ncbi:MAG: GAF domain-containing SpoIIE family protein phosphatase [Candidatus Thermochlorobacter sp.]
MQNSSRLIYSFIALALISEAVLLVIDIGLFYAQRARMLSGGLYFLKDLLASIVVAVMYFVIRNRLRSGAQSDSQVWVEPINALWKGLMLLGLLVLLIALLVWIAPQSNYDILPPTGILRPQSLHTVFKTHFIAVSFGIILLMALVILERLILFRRTKNTQFNLLAMIALFVLTSLSEFGSFPSASRFDLDNLFMLLVGTATTIMMLINLFRLSWILPLSRNDKIQALFLVIVILAELFALFKMDVTNHLLAYSSVAGLFFIRLQVFLSLYLIFTLLTLLLYLPTLEALERKTSEVRNLNAMSRFAAEVLDEEKIYSSLVDYACGAAGASACAWVDLYQPFGEKTIDATTASRLPNLQWQTSAGFFKTIIRKNVSEQQLHRFAEKAQFLWEEMVHQPRQISINDVATDKRIVKKDISPLKAWVHRFRSKGSKEPEKIVSTLSVPLISRASLIGVLTVAKDVEYGFVKDDIDLITSFADQAAIAVQNSRLIHEVIDKERMQQELSVAQKIQLQLLPAEPLTVRGYEMDSVSYPAFEVGGDFYDYMLLHAPNGHAHKFGVIVADVSGKGISAAFYMAELKGIFQSLCALYPDHPTDLLRHANETLSRSLDKKSFVSALYAIFDAEHHTLHFSNAGHCPMILLNEHGAQMIKMRGLALGLDKGTLFNRVITEEELSLQPGDAVVLYTDGLVEAVNASDEQFGFERLLHTLSSLRCHSATEIKNAVVNAVNLFAGEGGSIKDDLTILVVKRCADTQGHQHETFLESKM